MNPGRLMPEFILLNPAFTFSIINVIMILEL